MKKIYLLLCMVSALLLCACKTDKLEPEEKETIVTDTKVEEDETDKKEPVADDETNVTDADNEDEDSQTVTTNIDWTDFIKFEGNTYENEGVEVPEDQIDSQIGDVKGNPPWQIEGTEYTTKDGEAGWLPVGTRLYSVKKLDKADYISAYFENQYILYKTEDSWFVDFKNTSEEEEPPKKVSEKERKELTKAAGYQDIYELPEEYTLDMAAENENYVRIKQGTVNSSSMIDFLTSVGTERPAMVREVSFTTEGDIIIYDYIYNGESFLVISDDSRDKFVSNGKIRKKNFNYIERIYSEDGDYVVFTQSRGKEDQKENMVFLDEKEISELDGINLLKLGEN